MRWLPEGSAGRADRLDPAGVRRALRWISGDGDVPPEEVASRALDRLLGAADRDRLLREVADRFDRAVDPGHRVALPPRIWEALTQRAGTGAPPFERVWIGARQAEGFPHDGASHALGAEWWADSRHLGATYGDRLWAWGTTRGSGLPRDAWRWTGEAFVPSPVLVDLADRVSPRPPVERGPGRLVACLADATFEVARGAPLTHRDGAALWGAFFLPLLATSVGVDTPPVDGSGAPPDYALQLAFHLLHPRARAAVLVLDRLATWADAGDLPSLRAVLGDEAATAPEAVARLLAPIARSALARDAADLWDGGLGFRLLRRILRALTEASDVPAALDEALHGPPGDPSPTGPLADRLREAFGTALTYADRRTRGAASSQLVDFALLRWSDPDFLPLPPSILVGRGPSSD